MYQARISIPNWLAPLMGARERRIASTPGVRVLAVDRDGNRLPDSQRLIETPAGDSFQICSQRRAIVN